MYILPQYFERQEVPFPSCIPKKKLKAVCCYAKWGKWVFIWKDWEKVSWRQQRTKRTLWGLWALCQVPKRRSRTGRCMGRFAARASSAALEELHRPVLTSCHPKQSSHLVKAKMLVCSLDRYTFFRTWAPSDPLPSSVSPRLLDSSSSSSVCLDCAPNEQPSEACKSFLYTHLFLLFITRHLHLPSAFPHFYGAFNYSNVVSLQTIQ